MDSDSVKPESGSSVNSASKSDARLMTVEVRQSMKHPMGHTVYECVVGIPSTRQVCALNLAIDQTKPLHLRRTFIPYHQTCLSFPISVVPPPTRRIE